MSLKKLLPIKHRATESLPARREDDEFLSLRREMNRLFDDFLGGFSLAPSRLFESAEFMPRVNVTESDKDVVVSAELPGLDEKDLDISLARGVLTLKGEKKEEKEEKNQQYYHLERSYGSFLREIAIPDSVDTDKAKAAFAKGVLTVSMPKRPEAMQERKRISIKAE